MCKKLLRYAKFHISPTRSELKTEISEMGL